MAEREGDAETPRPCARIDREAEKREGCEANHRGTESCTSWLGSAAAAGAAQRPTKRPGFTWDQLYGMGLHRLMGMVKYPPQATPTRLSLSRVPENGMHGLKGEIRNGLALPVPR